MELSIDPETAERIAWGVWGVVSFIALIAWCRWRGTPQDQEKDEPAQGAEREKNDKKVAGEINPSARDSAPQGTSLIEEIHTKCREG